MSARFQNSIVVSIVIHLSIIGPSLSAVNAPDILHRENKPVRPLEVDYLIIKEPVKPDAAPKPAEIKAVQALKSDTARIKTGLSGIKVDDAAIIANKNAVIKPRYAKARAEPDTPRAANTERSTIKRLDAKGDIPVGDIIKKQARIRTTKEFISYFSLIRENIRQELKTRYRNYHGEGDVQLVFVLDSDGRLAGIEAAGSSALQDSKLSGIAIESVRQASPFPRFPKTFSLRQMYFSLVVSFKRQ